MPGRISSMESPNPSTPSAVESTNRRRSGRAIQKPVLYQQAPNVAVANNVSASGKRKRAEPALASVGQDTSGEEEESGVDETESEADEEEVKDQRRRAPKAKKGPVKQAAKRPKTTQERGVKLAMRPASYGGKNAMKPKKSRAKRFTVDKEAGTGLFCMHYPLEPDTI